MTLFLRGSCVGGGSTARALKLAVFDVYGRGGFAADVVHAAADLGSEMKAKTHGWYFSHNLQSAHCPQTHQRRVIGKCTHKEEVPQKRGGGY